MKSQSNDYPSIIQKLDSTTFVFNYNIEKKTKQTENEEEVYYEYDQIVINTDKLDHDEIIRETINTNFDINQQLKLVNDYHAYIIGLVKDESYKTRYEDFLSFRYTIKNKIQNLLIL